MVYKLTIIGKLDNLNDYITACRTNQYKGAKLKHHNEHKVAYAIYERTDGTSLTEEGILIIFLLSAVKQSKMRLWRHMFLKTTGGKK